MFRKIGVIASLAVLASLATGLAYVHASSHIKQPETLVTWAHDSLLDYVDVNTDHKPLGDMLVGAGPLYNQADTQRVGRWAIHCIVVSGSRAPQCVADLIIPGRGGVSTDGMLSQPKFRFSVTGGTSEFANVRGAMEAAVYSKKNEVKLTFHLLP